MSRKTMTPENGSVDKCRQVFVYTKTRVIRGVQPCVDKRLTRLYPLMNIKERERFIYCLHKAGGPVNTGVLV